MDDILPTMQKTVAWLQQLGFHTTDSGDGVTNVEAGMECAVEFSHVFMLVEPSLMVVESERLWNLFVLRGAQDDPDIRVEVMYSPLDKQAVLALYGVTDAVLARLSS